ncbi:MAG: hypothetical protein U0Z75_06470 [Deinococcaceae bacterium]
MAFAISGVGLAQERNPGSQIGISGGFTMPVTLGFGGNLSIMVPLGPDTEQGHLVGEFLLERSFSVLSGIVNQKEVYENHIAGQLFWEAPPMDTLFSGKSRPSIGANMGYSQWTNAAGQYQSGGMTVGFVIGGRSFFEPLPFFTQVEFETRYNLSRPNFPVDGIVRMNLGISL